MADIKDILALPIHDVSLAFPPMLGPEREAMKASIAADGVQRKVSLWRSESGDLWFVDGRTRRDLYKELVEEGVIDREKTPLPYEIMEACSEAEMIGRVGRAQMHHRQMTPGQRAAMAIKIVNMENTKRKEPKLRPAKNDKSQPLDKVAAQLGVSRTSVYEAAAMSTAAPDLFAKVIAGETSLNEATEEFLRRQGKKTRQQKAKEKAKPAATQAPAGNGSSEFGQSESGQPDAGQGSEQTNGAAPAAETNGAAAKPELVLDGLNRPVLIEELQGVFAYRGHIAGLVKQASQLSKAIKELCETDAGAKMHGQEMAASLKQVSTMLKKNQPYAVCEHCGGAGEMQTGDVTAKGKPKTKKCEVCSGDGFVDEVIYGLHKKKQEQAQATANGEADTTARQEETAGV